MDIYKNISPLDHRYFVANKSLFAQLSNYLSEDAHIQYILRIETELLAHYIHTYFADDKEQYLALLKRAKDATTSQEVYEKEVVSQHHINAVVSCLKEKLPSELSAYAHLGGTSADIIDTAYALSLRDSSYSVIIPLLIELELALISIAEQEAETPQTGRTHGQAAVPITVGYMFAEYVSRLGQSIGKLIEAIKDICGQFSGAVGGHHASSLINSDPLAFESAFLARLGLNAAEYSTQIVPPEYMLRVLTEYNIAFGIIANMADDLRNLQRSEIDEIHEVFESAQVGSSTMPHKRNPWNSEHVKSLWKTFAPRVLSFYLDQISEHQRDLTNSASTRFIADYLAGFTAAVARILKISKNIHINTPALKQNLQNKGDMVLAEPVYILLALAREPQAHEIVKQLTLRMEQSGDSLYNVLKQDPAVWNTLVAQMKRVNITDVDKFFIHPEQYRGKTVEITRTLCEKYRTKMSSAQNQLKEYQKTVKSW